jgi:hypothetical protein
MKKQYPCRHCGTLWPEKYLADLCFDLDMENLIKVKNDKPYNKIPGGKKQSGSKQLGK